MLTAKQIEDYRFKYGIGHDDHPEGSTSEGILQGIKSDFNTRVDTAAEAQSQSIQGKLSPIAATLKTLGQGAGMVGDLGMRALGAITPSFIKEPAKAAVESVASTGAAQGVMEGYKSWATQHPDAAASLEGVVNIAGIIPGAQAVSAVERGAVAVSKKVAQSTSKVASKVANSGIAESTKEIAERVPRFVERVQDSAQQSAMRAARIKSSSPSMQAAIKSNVDDRVLSTVEQADAPTLKGYKDIIDTAESSKTGTLKVKKRPELIAGTAAEEQYKIIDKQRQSIGKQIGDAVTKLSKTTSVDMTDGLYQIDNVLGTQGVKINRGANGTDLNFSGSRFTPVERTKIQELYNLATEAGRNLSPAQIYDKDRLFSKLQRESRFEGVGDIVVDTPDGTQSLFRVFRDMYAKQLDNVSPEDIRALNKQYRSLVTLTDDIESSIVKGGNFETSKNVDPAQFAQTNLRRVLSDAQSAAAYREILANMDKVARELGYAGANPEDLIAFATEMRKLYESTIPANSFQGGIKTSISDIAETVLSAGKPNVADQQKALRALIESRLKETVR